MTKNPKRPRDPNRLAKKVADLATENASTERRKRPTDANQLAKRIVDLATDSET